jgi:hypothetical protein
MFGVYGCGFAAFAEEMRPKQDRTRPAHTDLGFHAAIQQFREEVSRIPKLNCSPIGTGANYNWDHSRKAMAHLGCRRNQHLCAKHFNDSNNELTNYPTIADEAKARVLHIDPQSRAADWKLNDRAQVRLEVPVDGYDAEPWNGVTDYCLYDSSGNGARGCGSQ